MLRLENVGYAYTRRSRALKGVSCELSSSRVAILGPNGAGKSTLLSLLTTTTRPTTGRVGLDEWLDYRQEGLRRFRSSLGYVPQSLRIFEGYRCEDFLRYVAWLRLVSPDVAESNITKALQAVGLESVRRDRVRSLSGGMHQRLALAQALVNRPQLLVLDEPTVGLDPRQRVEYRSHLLSIATSTTVIFATHLVEDVAALASEVVVLDAGQLRFAGTLAAFCDKSDGETVLGKEIEERYLTLVRNEPSA